MLSTLLTFALGATGALAHGGVLSYSNAGNWYWGWQPYDTPTGQTSIQRPWSSYNPIQGASSSTLACNDDGTAGALQLSTTMAAGSSVTGYWNPWPHNTGPMLVYLSACNGNCTSVNTVNSKWFKISEAGLISGTIYNGSWAAGEMIADNSSWTVTIPKTVPSGNYFIRFETIALHSMPAQYYPECAQITITGGGTLQPTADELVTFPGGYSDNDPGLNIDIYDVAAETTYNYTIPGPPLYGSSSSSGGGGGGTTVAPTTVKPTTVSPTTVKPTTVSPTSSPSSTGTVAEYGQCGGQGWTGGTVCAAGLVCSAQNAYYSQCLPS